MKLFFFKVSVLWYPTLFFLEGHFNMKEIVR